MHCSLHHRRSNTRRERVQQRLVNFKTFIHCSFFLIMSTEFPEINEDDEDDQEIMLTYKKIWNSVDQHIQENEYDDPIFYYMEEGEGSLFIDNNTLTKISVYITESMKTTDISY